MLNPSVLFDTGSISSVVLLTFVSLFCLFVSLLSKCWTFICFALMCSVIVCSSLPQLLTFLSQTWMISMLRWRLSFLCLSAQISLYRCLIKGSSSCSLVRELLCRITADPVSKFCLSLIFELHQISQLSLAKIESLSAPFIMVSNLMHWEILKSWESYWMKSLL